MIKKIIALGAIFLASLICAQTASAAGEIEYILEKPIVSLMPIFMEGHPNDPNWIAGFDVTTDVRYQGSNIGMASVVVYLLDPPMRLTSPYAHSFQQIYNDLPGIGTFEVTSKSLGLASSTTAAQGDVVFSWSGSISTGTGSLANTYGLSSGVGVVNIYTGQGSIKEILRIRTGY